MSEQRMSQSDTLSLDSLTLALVVSGMGVCTDAAVADLRRYVESKAITHSSLEFDFENRAPKQTSTIRRPVEGVAGQNQAGKWIATVGATSETMQVCESRAVGAERENCANAHITTLYRCAIQHIAR